ncbi:hypothetical protein ACHAWO_008477 [Cyclotella atomus]|uniref:Uncharacterized protein n=1 Tax=Cyclotella atomus TaxID=382360 RepID=A0ABD3QHQ0_9STRA
MDRLAELLLGSALNHQQAATQGDLEELKGTARLLRGELDQVIEDEVASDQACEAANVNIERLQAIATEKILCRDELRKESHDVGADLQDVNDACHGEEQKLLALHQRIEDLNEERRQAATDAVDLQKTAARIRHTLETTVPETLFRLRADVQNLQTECEIEQIKLREIQNQQSVAQNKLDTTRQQREEIQSRAAELHKQLKEEKTHNELLHTRNQFLTDQLQGIGGKVPKDNVISSVQDLFSKITTRGNHRHSMIMKPSRLHNSPCRSDHQSHSASLGDLRNSQQNVHTSIKSDQLFYMPPLLHQMNLNPNEGQSENNVYKPGHRQGISILCKDDDSSIVSALTVDEAEFKTRSGRVEEEQE